MARRDQSRFQQERHTLRVGEAKQRDVGKKRARINQSVMDGIGIKSGDIITISGPAKKSCAIAWPADEDERNEDIVRIDGQTRKSAGTALGEQVGISHAETQPARTMVLTPVGEPAGASHNGIKRKGAAADRDFVEFAKGRLSGFPVMPGDEISVMILASPRKFRVSSTQPRGITIIDDATSITISDNEPESDAKARVTYEEVGGLRKEVGAMREIVELPLRHPELFSMLGIEPHSGILLYGPPGCGKTLLARVLASESEARMFLINGPEIVTKYYGDTEAKLREIFKEAKDASPSIIFIDEIDAIAPRREDVRGDVEKRMVAQLLALMDGLDDRGNVMVLGATNRPDSVDPALRRPGRFDREFEIWVPNEDGRYEILLIHTRGMPISPTVDIRNLASELHGYTGADIKSLCREAAMRSIRRYLKEIDLETAGIPAEILYSMQVELDDFYDAMQEIVPTAMREFYVERPTARWQDVGGLYDAKQALADNIIAAIRDPGKFTNMGIKPPRGALVYGPPGCGKTMLAKALAAETGANMILVRGPEILSKWVGEAEKAVREIFRKAKASAPCVVIIDELDSLARHRAGGGAEGTAAAFSETILSQLLTEMEEASPRVAVIGITSRPDLLDRSLLRTGRLDLAIYTGAPDEKERLEIIEILTAKMPLADNVKLEEIAAMTQNHTGADLAALCREAAVSAIKSESGTVSSLDFAEARKRAGPSITEESLKWYATVREGISNVVPASSDKVAFYG